MKIKSLYHILFGIWIRMIYDHTSLSHNHIWCLYKQMRFHNFIFFHLEYITYIYISNTFIYTHVLVDNRCVKQPLFIHVLCGYKGVSLSLGLDVVAVKIGDSRGKEGTNVGLLLKSFLLVLFYVHVYDNCL